MVVLDVFTDGCPADKCYYMSREEGLCIAFFEDGGTYSSGESRKLCKDNDGHLVILDTKKKTQWVARMIASNTGKSSRVMGIYLFIYLFIYFIKNKQAIKQNDF